MKKGLRHSRRNPFSVQMTGNAGIEPATSLKMLKCEAASRASRPPQRGGASRPAPTWRRIFDASARFSSPSGCGVRRSGTSVKGRSDTSVKGRSDTSVKGRSDT